MLLFVVVLQLILMNHKNQLKQQATIKGVNQSIVMKFVFICPTNYQLLDKFVVYFAQIFQTGAFLCPVIDNIVHLMNKLQ